MGAKGSLSRKLARTLSKFTNYSPQCIIMLKENKDPHYSYRFVFDPGSGADSCWASLCS